MYRKNFVYIIILLLYPFSLIHSETPEWGISITGTRNVTRERVATFVELTNLKTGVCLKKVSLPGNEVLRIMENNESQEQRYLIATRDSSIDNPKNADDGIFLTSFTSSLDISQIKYLSLPSGRRIEKVEFFSHPPDKKLTYVVFLSKNTDKESIGSICIFEDVNEIINDSPLQIPLPYSPYKVMPIKNEGLWIIIPKEAKEETICVTDIYLKTSRLIPIEGIEGKINEIFQLDKEHLGIIVGPTLEEETEQSKIYAINLWNWQIVSEPISVWGVPPEKEDCAIKSSYGIWVRTESIRDGFGYVSLLQWNPVEGFSKKWETFVVGIEQNWSISPHPKQFSAIICTNNKIDVVTNEGLNRFSQTLDEEITYSTWLNESSLIASGGKVYKLDLQSGKLIPAMITQSGWLEKILPIEFPIKYSPNIGEVKRINFSRVTLTNSDIGRDIRTVVLSESSPNYEEWNVSSISKADDNLLWYTEKREESALLYFGLIPHPTSFSHTYWLIAYNYPSDDSATIQNKQHIIQLKIARKKTTPAKILWVFGEGDTNFRTSDDPQQLKYLADILAIAPFYFVQDAVTTPIKGELEDYTLVIADVISFARGHISIKQASDYIKNGGNLLIIGGYYPDSYLEFLEYWLLTLGIQFDPHTPTEGNLPISCELNYISKNFSSLQIKNGGLLKKLPKPTETEKLEVANRSNEENQIFAFISTNYGKGRLGILASKYPLTSTQLKNPTNLEIAIHLFKFLSRDIDISEDTDGDNLPDKIEDRNGNGIFDIGETSPIKLDTDGDMIPDGIEDENLNGLWDENETDPTCNDTDGDGIWDGADVSPIPTVKEAVITRIEPITSPAEGGTMVLIEGRNFSPETKFYFGRRPSPFVKILSPERALVVSPDYQFDQGGLVDVKAVSKNLPQSSSTKKFQYTPRTEVKVKIKNPEPTTTGGQQVIVEPPSRAIINKVLLLIRVSEQVVNLNGTVSDSRWGIEIKPLKDKWYIVSVERKKTGLVSNRLIIEIVPHIESSNPSVDPIKIERIWVLNRYGGRLKVKLAE